MRKVIKIRAVLSEDKQTASLILLEQSHFGLCFGREAKPAGTEFKAREEKAKTFYHGSIRLVSHDPKGIHMGDFIPDAVQESNPEITKSVYMGGFRGMPVGLTCPMPVSLWPSIKEAIEAYNRHEFDL